MSFLGRIRARQRVKSIAAGDFGYDLAALHLRLLVAMAAADDQLRAVEVEELAKFVEVVQVTPEERVRLQELLRMLVDAPPDVHELLATLIALEEGAAVAEILVNEISSIARVDDYIDHREEALLRLVCGAFGLPPRTLYTGVTRVPTADETAQLRDLVHTLVEALPPLERPA